MNMGGLLQPTQSLLSGRFLLVSYLPTLCASLFILTLVWGGAPGRDFTLSRAWPTAAALGVGELVLIGLAVLVIAVLAAPLQLSAVRLLEGAWPSWLGAKLRLRRHANRRRRMREEAVLHAPPSGGAPTESEIQRAGVASTRLRRRYPLPEHLLRPTILGNVLAAMEDTAGRIYGFDAVTAWPRLYPLLSPPVRAIVDDRRDSLDTSARMVVTFSTTTAATVVLLGRNTWWIFLAAVPALAAVAAYNGAVQGAHAYAEAVHMSFDLHRFDLLKALHLALPTDPSVERELICPAGRPGCCGSCGRAIRSMSCPTERSPSATGSVAAGPASPRGTAATA